MARDGMRRAFALAWAGAFLFLICSIPAQAAAPSLANPDPIPAGKFDLVVRDVQILQPGKPARAAHQGDAVMEGDTLVTGKDAEAHLTMSDTGFLALRANTRIQIVSFKADGGDDDHGVLNLFSGALRSISGWIGKFNRPSYKLRTPTATIGIRGTDHETRYVPPGSSEGEPGTYDKVFTGETTIESDTGQTVVSADHAGYAPNQGSQQPRVLPRIPGFFKPGPHEDLINKKHEEIQKMIIQRRDERRKIVEQKRAQFRAAQRETQQQAAANKAAGEARLAAEAEQKQDTERERAALRSRGEALQKDAAALQEKRKALQQRLIPALRANAGLREQFRAVRETGETIRQEYQAIREGRQAITERSVAANEARKNAAEEQRKQSEARLAQLNPTADALKQKWVDLAAAREALEKRAGLMAPPELARRRKELNTRNDALQEQQKRLAAGFDALFYSNIGAAQSRVEDARAQRTQNVEQARAFNGREDAVQERQRINEDKLEMLQAQAIEKLGGDKGLSAQLRDIHDAVQAIRAKRVDLAAARRALEARNLAAAGQRQDDALQQIDLLRAKHREMENKRSDLQNEQKATQEEIRALFQQEQKRYREELRADRESGAENQRGNPDHLREDETPSRTAPRQAR
ncbi:MAG TPA: FecR domain-containing protein [Burkholderiales bacterium]|nr:FecR domain-containing protein [Burkholderiales bacterium]